MTAFDEGRYLYCVVRADDPDPTFSATGLDDGSVSVVAEGGLGAVVQPCEALFDSDSPAEIRRWLLRHQEVVDEAGEAFGTPLPFQFDTILKGDDARVREWLREESATLGRHLEELSGRWEYRIEVARDDDEAAAAIAEEDEELRELGERLSEASEGKGFLLEKQYDRRLRGLLRERREEQTAALAGRLRPHVEELRDLGERRSVGLELGDDEERAEPFARFAALATDEGADALGDELESIAADPGVEVRFTGPWPPYTFAPELGGEGDEGDGTGA
ncbi:gas vesicle protein GvpL [Halegenticoccus tardaugens]|uniref:gas vesicle protein GvpL n=1 Tax=Halegenticoccus tardaugens TaxID=2071624 RepID=UPI00100A289A|nr:GvpL/GvpF family gas vesicle protein [Halegenticoccus tardaugens]